jgi:hypothetical protein
MKWPLVLGAAAFLAAGFAGETLLGAAIAAGAVTLQLICGAEEAELRKLWKNAPKNHQEPIE